MSKKLTLLVMILFLSGLLYSQNRIRIGYLTDKGEESFTEEEKKGLEWLKTNFPSSESIKFDDLTKNNIESQFDALWWHYNREVDLPQPAKEKEVKEKIRGFVEKGKGLLLTLLASQYTVELGIETVKPNVVVKEGWVIKDDYKEIKGYHSFNGHPLFEGLFDGVYTWNTKKDYPYSAAYYNNEMPAKGKIIGIGWDYITFNENERHIIEYNPGKGKCITAGAYLYFADNKNVYRPHLEKFITNIFGYITNKKSKERISWWSFEPLDFVVKKDKNNIKFSSSRPAKVDLSFSSGLEMKQEAKSKSYFGVYGLRAQMMGKENGGLDEVWVHPFRALRNYSVTVDGKPLNEFTPVITVRPESFIRNYEFNNNKVDEVLFASRKLPSGVINYTINASKPVKLKIAFEVDNRVMWPFEESYPGKYSVQGKNPVQFLSGDKTICSLFGTDIECETSVRVLDSKENTKYALVEFALDLREGVNTFNFIFAASNEGQNKTEGYYKSAAANISRLYKEQAEYFVSLFRDKTMIKTQDKEFNDAYKWAVAGVDKFFVYTYPLGSSFMAGMGTTERGWNGGQKINGRPGYAWYFGRDSEWTSLAVLDYGDFEKVKAVLLFLGKYQDLTGKIFHELTSSNAVHYDAADSTPLYIILMGKYLNATGDIEFIKKEWNRIKKSIDFCYSTDTDGDGLIENTNVGHGWVEGGKIYGAHVTFYLAGLWASALEYGSALADVVRQKDLAGKYAADSKKVKGIIERDFWNSDTRFYNDGKNIDGKFSDTKTIQVTVPMYFNSTDNARSAESVKEFFGNEYTTNWGARIIAESNPMFNPRGYHYGTVWPLFTGWGALAEYKYGYGNQAFQLVMSNLLNYKDWGLGYIEEVLHGSEYKPAGVCSHQAWSESMAIQPLLEGMIDIKPDALNKNVSIFTQIPSNFEKLTVENIKFGKSVIHLSYETDYDNFSYSITGGKGEKITLGTKLFAGAVVKSVLLNGKPAEYKIKGGFVTLEFKLRNKNSIKIETAEGAAIDPVITRAVENGKPYGTRILNEELRENKYKIELEIPSGKEERLTLRSSRDIKKIQGANLISQIGKTKIIEVKQEKSSNNYGKMSIEVEF